MLRLETKMQIWLWNSQGQCFSLKLMLMTNAVSVSKIYNLRRNKHRNSTLMFVLVETCVSCGVILYQKGRKIVPLLISGCFIPLRLLENSRRELMLAFHRTGFAIHHSGYMDNFLKQKFPNYIYTNYIMVILSISGQIKHFYVAHIVYGLCFYNLCLRIFLFCETVSD